MEEHEKIVVDASIAVKWFVPEKSYEKAVKIRDKYVNGEIEIYAPNIIIYEVSNALRFHRIYRLNAEIVRNAIKNLFMLGIIRNLDGKAWDLAVELSYQHNIPMYDAAYAGLAKATSSVLVTSDKELYDELENIIDIALLESLKI